MRHQQDDALCADARSMRPEIWLRQLRGSTRCRVCPLALPLQ
jgi:hypothetical protein